MVGSEHGKVQLVEGIRPRHNFQGKDMNEMIDRAARLFQARRASFEELARVQAEIAREMLPSEVLHNDAACADLRSVEYRDGTAFEATAGLGKAIGVRLITDPKRYDLRICEPSMFRSLWVARQMIDKTGIAYGTYIDMAVSYLRDVCKKKRITPKMLVSAEVQMHVMDHYQASL